MQLEPKYYYSFFLNSNAEFSSEFKCGYCLGSGWFAFHRAILARTSLHFGGDAYEGKYCMEGQAVLWI